MNENAKGEFFKKPAKKKSLVYLAGKLKLKFILLHKIQFSIYSWGKKRIQHSIESME